jgi:hypothetical protein
MRPGKGLFGCGVLLAGGLALAGNASGGAPPGATTEVFDHVDADQPFTVPDHVCQVTIDAVGAEGGNYALDEHFGGSGQPGRVSNAVLDVTPGEQLIIVAAGRGENGSFTSLDTAHEPFGGFGAPAGGNGGAIGVGRGSGGGGGGASAVFQAGNPVVVAAGGGGGGGISYGSGGGDGGDGGELGTDGGDGPYGANGADSGGNGGAGGPAFGIGATAGSNGGPGIDGGSGGDPGEDEVSPDRGGGAGGGGGGGASSGGGGGGGGGIANQENDQGGGGGGGGSSTGPAGSTYTTGAEPDADGNGVVTVTYEPEPTCEPDVLPDDTTPDVQPDVIEGRPAFTG